jgi:peptide/nickel transport system permease protein
MSITQLTPRGRGARLGAGFAMFRNGKSVAGLSILAVFVVVAVFADQLAPFSPTQIDATARLQPPSGTHWFGTTHLGEDVLSQAHASTPPAHQRCTDSPSGWLVSPPHL